MAHLFQKEICFRKISGSNMGAPSSLIIPLTLMSTNKADPGGKSLQWEPWTHAEKRLLP